MAVREHRKLPRKTVHVLAALRRKEGPVVTWSGFARTLNLSAIGALLESPDHFQVKEKLALEFLLDDSQLAKVDGLVRRVSKSKRMYHIALSFLRITDRAKRLIAKQIKG